MIKAAPKACGKNRNDALWFYMQDKTQIMTKYIHEYDGKFESKKKRFVWKQEARMFEANFLWSFPWQW